MKSKALLDTDIFSEVLKGRDTVIVMRAQEYLQEYSVFTISAISVMEIICGYQRIGRQDKLEQFLQITNTLEIIPFDRESAALAGRIDGDLWRTGQRIGRADPMIAAQAIVNQLVLVSGNVEHYLRVQSLGYPLQVENWRSVI
ncbi:MAG: PIN domain-containing protein [Fimbriimonadales bacterium]